MKVKDVICKLSQYDDNDQTIPDNIVNNLFEYLDGESKCIFDINNFADSFPNYKDFKLIEIILNWQNILKFLDVVIITTDKEGKEKDDYEETNDIKKFHKRMKRFINKKTVLTDEYKDLNKIINCFSNSLKGELHELGIGMVISIERYNDT